MIQTAHFKNFKILRQVWVDLQPLTVIVGPNSSGKTSILQALDCLTRCITSDDAGDLRDKVFQGEFSPRLVRSRELQGQLELGCSGNLGDNDFTFTVSLEEEGPARPKTRFGTTELPEFVYPSHFREI